MQRDDVRRVAELARLSLSDEDADRMAQQLTAVLAFVAQLDSLDLEGCEPSVFAPEDRPGRPDKPNGRRLDADTATANAPESADGFFIVPPVVENVEP